jgi:hypothetical protein
MILTIIKSRFKKDKEEDWVKKRRETCKGCSYNSKNVEIIPFNKKITIWLSNFYSWITGKKREDNLGNCFGCPLTCSIYYKSNEELEVCPKEYWEKL